MLLDKGPIESIKSTQRLSEAIQDKTELVSLLSITGGQDTTGMVLGETYPVEETALLLQSYYKELLHSNDNLPESKTITIGKGESCTIILNEVPCTIFLDAFGSLAFEYDKHYIEFNKADIGKTSLRIAVGSTFPFLCNKEEKKDLENLSRIKKDGITLNSIMTVSIDKNLGQASFLYRHVPKDEKGNKRYGEYTDYTISLSLGQLRDLLNMTKYVKSNIPDGSIEVFVADYPSMVTYFLDLPEEEFPEKFKEFISKDLHSIKINVWKKPLSHSTLNKS